MPRASSAIPAGVAPWREVTGSPMRWKELPVAAVGLEVCQKHQILGDVYGTSLGINIFLVGGWPTPLKNMTSSVGMMKFPIYGKKQMCHTTNQYIFIQDLSLESRWCFGSNSWILRYQISQSLYHMYPYVPLRGIKYGIFIYISWMTLGLDAVNSSVHCGLHLDGCFTWMFFHLDLNGLSTSTPTQDNLSVIWLQLLRQTLWLQKRCHPVHGSFHDICIAGWLCHGYVIFCHNICIAITIWYVGLYMVIQLYHLVIGFSITIRGKYHQIQGMWSSLKTRIEAQGKVGTLWGLNWFKQQQTSTNYGKNGI